MSCDGPTPSTETPDRIDQAALDHVARLLPLWLEDVRIRTEQSGLQAAIWYDGALICETAVGAADVDGEIPLLPTHRLRIASHSKMFTALAVMRLVERGDLRLDDTLGERVAALEATPVADRTLRDLLSHSAGISRDSSDARWWQLTTAFPSREELLEIARTDAVVCEPGLHLQYSNIGYGLLGLVIEETTGKEFTDAVMELVVDPVGAGPIGPDWPADAHGPEQADGFALGHTRRFQGRRSAVEQVPTGALAAATGFWATAGAIASFAGEVLTRDALLDPRRLREMRRRVWTVGEASHYGLGLQEGTINGFSAIGHSGGFPTGLTRTWAVPDLKLAVSVLGTSIDAPSSELAAGLLGLVALAMGRPNPTAGDVEGSGALGGGSVGRPRPQELSAQKPVTVLGVELSAEQVAELVTGAYESLWARSRISRIGERLFSLPAQAVDPASGALELSVVGVRPDPMGEGEVVELACWGDAGYGTWAEPLLVRVAREGGKADDGSAAKSAGSAAVRGADAGDAPTVVAGLRCTGIIHTGMLLVPSSAFDVPDRVTAP